MMPKHLFSLLADREFHKLADLFNAVKNDESLETVTRFCAKNQRPCDNESHGRWTFFMRRLSQLHVTYEKADVKRAGIAYDPQDRVRLTERACKICGEPFFPDFHSQKKCPAHQQIAALPAKIERLLVDIEALGIKPAHRKRVVSRLEIVVNRLLLDNPTLS